MIKSNIRNFLFRLLLLFLFAGYTCMFAGWWVISPKGFSLTNPRFWTNSIIPIIVLIISLTGIFGLYRRQSILAVILPAYPAATLSFLGTGRILYPISVRPVFFVILLAWFLVLCLLVWAVVRHTKVTGKQLVLMFSITILSIFIGAFLPWSQRSFQPATRPLNPSDSIRIEQALNPELSPFHLSNRVTTMPQYASVLISNSENPLEVFPLLTFYSRSPDRCWILFAPRKDRIGPKRIFAGMRRIPEGIHLEYADDGRSILEVKASKPEEAIEIEAFSELPEAVYSHLNTYTYFTIQGKEKLLVSFSPCPEKRIEVTVFEYPFGKPARLAYLDETGMFRVVQAKSAEKGPFEILGEGPLADDQPLEMTLYDGEQALYRITFYDWTAQASTQLSPTAGWGLPENGIEFNLDREDPPKATFYLTLAGTSAGRGFDSVGHTPGTYRTRMQIVTLKK